MPWTVNTIDRDVGLCTGGAHERRHDHREIRFEFGSHRLADFRPCRDQVVVQECIAGIGGAI